MTTKEFFEEQELKLFQNYLNRESFDFSTQEGELTDFNYFKIIDTMKELDETAEDKRDSFLISTIKTSEAQMENEGVTITGKKRELALVYLSLSKVAKTNTGKGIRKDKFGEFEREYYADPNGWNKWLEMYFDLVDLDGKRIGYKGV